MNCKYCKVAGIDCRCSLANDEIYPDFVETLDGESIGSLIELEKQWIADCPDDQYKIIAIRVRRQYIEKLRDG